MKEKQEISSATEGVILCNYIFLVRRNSGRGIQVTVEKHRSATVTLEIVVTIQTRLVLCLRGKCNISEAQTTDESGRNINHSFPSSDLMSHGNKPWLKPELPNGCKHG